MLTIFALTVKKTITLFVLVAPLSMVPIFLATTTGLDLAEKVRFAKAIGFAVTVALLAAAFLGMPFLGMLGVSLWAMQVGGGVIVLLLAIAMVLGKESDFKGAPSISSEEGARKAAIVPLAIPLLAGPASFSYVMGNSAWQSYADLIHIVAPILIVGSASWAIFHVSCHAEKMIQQPMLDVVERVGGFVLAAMAVEMMAAGLRGLFPLLAPA